MALRGTIGVVPVVRSPGLNTQPLSDNTGCCYFHCRIVWENDYWEVGGFSYLTRSGRQNRKFQQWSVQFTVTSGLLREWVANRLREWVANRLREWVANRLREWVANGLGSSNRQSQHLWYTRSPLTFPHIILLPTQFGGSSKVVSTAP